MKKTFAILALALLPLALASCAQKSVPSSSTTSETSSSSSSSSESSSSSSQEPSSSSTNSSSDGPLTLETQTWGHVFEKKDFSQAGGAISINGLTWKYGAFKFLGFSDRGVQIGSGNNPQTSDWSFSSSLPEGSIVTSYEIGLSTASNGNGTATFSFGGESSIKQDFNKTQVTFYQGSNLEEKGTEFKLVLKSNVAKAMYLHSLKFTAEIPSNSGVSLTEDIIKAEPIEPGKNGIPTLSYPLENYDDDAYYKDVNDQIDLGASKENIESTLRSSIQIKTKTSYGDAKTMLIYADESKTTPGFLYGLYDGDLIKGEWTSGGSWNREHVWPCAKMGLGGSNRPNDETKNHGSDLHNLRAACPTANGKHGDKHYDEKGVDGAMFPNLTKDELGSVHKGEGDFRGDVARIVFYMDVHYDFLSLEDTITAPNQLGNLSTLLRWHQEDPVDNFEKSRNERIYGYQGNRNPFIDHPEYVNSIY